MDDRRRPGLARLLAHPAVAAVLVVGVVLRVWVLRSPFGVLNADEAYTGLQATEFTRGHLRVMFGGQPYTGTTDIYLLTPFVWVFGQHVVVLKLMSPVLWAVASVLTVGAARRVIDDRAALLAGAMTWLAPGALIVLSTRSYVGYAFGLCVVVATLWSALALVERTAPSVGASALTGALVGFAFYTHPIYVAVVGPVAAVVALRWYRHGREFWAPAVGAAVLVNVPFLWWNAVNSWPSTNLPADESGGTYLGRLRGFFTGLLPRDLGVRAITDGEWLFGRPVAAVVTVAVLAGAGYGAVRAVRADRWRGAVLAAPLVCAWPLMAMLSNLSFVDDGRYGIIVFPVLVLCLAVASEPLLDRIADRTPRWPAWSLWLTGAALWVVVLTVPFLLREAGTDLGDANRETQALIDALEAEGFDRVAGHFWAVLPIELQSEGRIRVAVAGNPYVIRLPHVQAMVEATPAERLAYVFDRGPVGPTWVKLPVDEYRQVPVGRWVIYFPN